VYGDKKTLPFVRFIDIDSSLTESAMLEVSKTNYRVGLVFLSAEYREGEDILNVNGDRLYFHVRSTGKVSDNQNNSSELPERIEVEDGSHLGVVATFPDGSRRTYTVVKSSYTVIQNDEVLRQALHVASRLGNKIRGIGRSKSGKRFAIRFEPCNEMVETAAGRQESFTRTLYVWTSHDASYTYSMAFLIQDPENRVIQDFTVKRRHTPKVNEDKEIEFFLTRLAEESKQTIEDIRRLAKLELTPEQVGKCIEVLVPMESVEPTNEESGDADSPRRTEQPKKKETRQLIFDKYNSLTLRYGTTAWSLYEAWIEVVMYGDQKHQRETFGSDNYGLILRLLADRASRTTSRYKDARRGLLEFLTND
jgi:hypothetical protein